MPLGNLRKDYLLTSICRKKTFSKKEIQSFKATWVNFALNLLNILAKI